MARSKPSGSKQTRPVKRAKRASKPTDPGREELGRREKELVALQEISLDLNRLRATGEVLGAIVRRARALVGSSISYLSAYDEEQKDFFVRAFDGIISRKFASIRVPHDLGSCRPIVESRSPFVTANYRRDPRFVHAASIDTALDSEGVVAMAAVPLLLDGRVLGILYVADRRARVYSPQEVALLLSLGTHAALALENARLYEESRQSLEALKLKEVETDTAVAVHEQLIDLVAKGGGLQEIAAMLSTVLQAEVAILDQDYRPIAQASVTPGHGYADRLQRGRNAIDLLRVLRESHTLGRAVNCSFERSPPCVAMTVVSATRILGALLVWRSAPLSDHEVRTVERGAIACGIVLLSLDRAMANYDRDVAEILMNLRKRTPRADAAFEQHLGRCGIDAREPVVCLLLDVENLGSNELFQTIRGAFRSRGVIASEVDGKLVLICAAAEAATVIGAARQRLGGDLNALKSESFRSGADFQRIFAKASNCLDLMRMLGKRGATCASDELHVYAVIFAERSRAELESFVTATVGPLIEYDRKRKGCLETTLRYYYAAAFNTGVAAAKLGIHENTLRQRLETIERLVGDWRYDRSFELQAALKLRNLIVVPGEHS